MEGLFQFQSVIRRKKNDALELRRREAGRRRASTRPSRLPVSTDQLRTMAAAVRRAEPQLTKAELSRRLAHQLFPKEDVTRQQRLARNVIRHHL